MLISGEVIKPCDTFQQACYNISNHRNMTEIATYHSIMKGKRSVTCDRLEREICNNKSMYGSMYTGICILWTLIWYTSNKAYGTCFVLTIRKKRLQILTYTFTQIPICVQKNNGKICKMLWNI